jgi:two-component system C4-dicarboxylate transport response regulator DctD
VGEAGRAGALLQAQGGTLLLDDIDRASPALQARLVQVLETRKVMVPHGREPLPLEMRVIGMSGVPLDDLAREGRLLPALLYRLSGVRITLPPLRERRVDVDRLFAHLLQESADRLRRPLPHDHPGHAGPSVNA